MKNDVHNGDKRANQERIHKGTIASYIDNDVNATPAVIGRNPVVSPRNEFAPL